MEKESTEWIEYRWWYYFEKSNLLRIPRTSKPINRQRRENANTKRHWGGKLATPSVNYLRRRLSAGRVGTLTYYCYTVYFKFCSCIPLVSWGYSNYGRSRACEYNGVSRGSALEANHQGWDQRGGVRAGILFGAIVCLGNPDCYFPLSLFFLMNTTGLFWGAPITSTPSPIP